MKNLANKKCYPNTDGKTFAEDGITFRERLIIALAENPKMIVFYPGNFGGEIASEETTNSIISQADSIIAQLEKDNDKNK